MSGLQNPARVAPTSMLRASAIRVLPAILAGAVLWVLVFFPEISTAIATWEMSTAYGHCFLVLPMALFLLWDRRDVALATPVRPNILLAALAIPVAAAWLFAERLGIMEGRQLMAVAALEVMLLAILGSRMARELSGPLLYLFFLVPFGMFLTPALQHFTARFTAGGLDLLGIPNYADDLVIEIPAGTFLVAEACAGLRFLIASVAFGVFYALLNYRSLVRRVVFVLASIFVPVVANGFRALGIVVLGHILGSAEAATADHIIYGWVFFSCVMMLLVVAGLPMREPRIGAGEGPVIIDPSRPGPAALWAAALACLAVAIGPAAARLLDARAVPVPLAALPAFELPPGCRWTDDPPILPATRVLRHLQCADIAFDVNILSFPARSTAASISAERVRLSGEFIAEDTSFKPLPTPPANGIWTLAVGYEPFQAAAIASWIDGQPAVGGITGRLQQARDSVFGAVSPPVLISASFTAPETIRLPARVAAIERLTTLIQAQTDLTRRLAAITRP